MAPGNGELGRTFRTLGRAPAYAATAIGVMALGVAMMTTVFAAVDGVLFKPLPYPEPQDVFALSGQYDDETEPPDRVYGSLSPREVTALRRSIPDLRMTLVGYSSVLLENGDRARAALIDKSFFAVFAVGLLTGGLDDADFAPGDRPIRPIVISYGLWQRQFNGDPAVLGRTFSTPLGPRTITNRIVGIMNPDGFVPPSPGSSELWLHQNRRIDVLMPDVLGPDFGERTGTPFARLPAARAGAMEGALRSAIAEYGTTVPPSRAPVIPGRRPANAPYDSIALVPAASFVAARQGRILTTVFLTACGLTILILLNMGALATTRAQDRLRDLALRRSLGAQTRDLLRTALMEQAALSIAGAALGLALAPSLMSVVVHALPPGLDLVKDVRLDWRGVTFIGLLSAAITGGIALMSVRFAVRHASVQSLLASTSSGAPAGGRFSRMLVAGQTAMAFALILGGALFLTSLGRVWSEDPGFESRNTALMGISGGGFVDTARRQALLAASRAVPGVSAAGAFSASVLDNFTSRSAEYLWPTGGAPMPLPVVMLVGSGFFEAAGIRAIAGRLPTDAELDANAPVIAINAALADQYWPNGNAVGQTLKNRSRVDNTVVGIVPDARLSSLDTEPAGTIFGPMSSRPQVLSFSMFVAFDVDPASAVRPLRSAIEASGMRVYSVRLVEDAIAETVRPRTISAIAAAAFAGAGLVVLGLGLFGLAAHTTGRRTREMGIRLALGSTPAGIVRLILLGQARTVLAGLSVGIFLAAAIARIVSSYLYDTTASDWSAWGVTIAVVALAALAGTLLPALRASRVNPISALRAD